MRVVWISVLVVLVSATVVGAQYAGGANRTSTILEKFFGEGEQVPWGRIVFHNTGDGKLCATVGAKRGPGALSSKSLVFEQRVDGKPKRLDFKFPSKPDRKDDDYLLWETCLDEPGVPTELLEVTLRNLGGIQHGGAAQKMNTPYPEGPLSSGLNLVKSSSGQIEWTSFQKTYG